MRDLERLHRFFNPYEEEINIIEQCRIVAEALAPQGEYEEDPFGLGDYLKISRTKVYQLNKIHLDMIPEVKVWFGTREYQANTTYNVAILSDEDQMNYLREKRGVDSLEPTVTEEEK